MNNSSVELLDKFIGFLEQEGVRSWMFDENEDPCDADLYALARDFVCSEKIVEKTQKTL